LERVNHAVVHTCHFGAAGKSTKVHNCLSYMDSSIK
jgi:hypothetical protein